MPIETYFNFEFVTEYRAGNSAVTEIVNRAAEMFGIGIANIAYLFNPGVVVGGQL